MNLYVSVCLCVFIFMCTFLFAFMWRVPTNVCMLGVRSGQRVFVVHMVRFPQRVQANSPYPRQPFSKNYSVAYIFLLRSERSRTASSPSIWTDGTSSSEGLLRSFHRSLYKGRVITKWMFS